MKSSAPNVSSLVTYIGFKMVKVTPGTALAAGRVMCIMTEYPCKTCGEDTFYYGATLCENCWEIETRLKRYMQTSKGLNYVHRMLAEVIEENLNGRA
jgi:hypothetical protein